MNINKDKGLAIFGTLFFHALVVLILFLMAFHTPLPLPGEEGVEVDLGMYNQGKGDIQPAKPEIPEESISQPKQEQTKVEEEFATQDTEEVPAIVEKKPEKNIQKPKEELAKTEKPQPQVNPKALFKGNNKAKEGGSEGITGQPGDQGNPNGLANIKQYDGNGGTGTGYSLGGRGAKVLQSPNEDFTEEGHIVVNIWVDRDGNVTKTEISTKGTDIVNRDMREKAVRAASQSKFASDPNAPEIQKGSITYTFINTH